MFLDKYLNEFYFNQVINTYEEDYLNTLDERNFYKIYQLFSVYEFYYIDDIILKYLEIFSMDYKDVNRGILKLKDKLGDLFVYKIGNNMTYLNEIIEEGFKEFED